MNTQKSIFKCISSTPLLMLALVFTFGELKTCIPFLKTDLHAASPSKTDPTLLQLKKLGAYAAPLAAGHKEVRVDFSIGAKQVSDNDIKALANVKGLVELNLGQTKITDNALSTIAQISSLKKLNLNNTNITDQGVKALSDLKLEYLNLYGCGKITDQSVATLSNMKSLKSVYLWKSGISANGGKKLTAALSNAQINTGVDFEKFKQIKAEIEKNEKAAKEKAAKEKAAKEAAAKKQQANKPTAQKDDKKMPIKQIMKEAHKSGLSKKVITGKASVADKKKLVAYYKVLIQHEAPKGSQEEWKKRTKALLAAAEAVIKGEKNAQLTLSKVVNCKQCHKVHKP